MSTIPDRSDGVASVYVIEIFYRLRLLQYLKFYLFRLCCMQAYLLRFKS